MTGNSGEKPKTKEELAKGMEITKEEAKKLNAELDNIMDYKPSLEEQEKFRKKLEEPPTTLEHVYETTGKYLHINDKNRIDLILATALSNQIPGTPIWMFIVGNSGDWKSAFIKSLEGIDNCIKIDRITKNTLATGMKDECDLGMQLHNSSHILLFPDMASMTSMHKEDKNEIWGQFRTLYDGDIFKRTGSGVTKEYENCHVTMIACTTQAIRDEILVHAQLGTRELMYDTEADAVDDKYKMEGAWKNEKYEEEMIREMQSCVHDFLKFNKIKDIEIPDDIKKFLFKEASRLKILRASANVDRANKELINPVYPEVPTRLIKQFKRIYISLKSLDENYPDEKVKEIITRIVDSSGDKVRQKIIKFLKNKKNFEFKIVDIHKKLKIGKSSIKRQLEILWDLDIVTKDIREERIGGYSVFDKDDGHIETRGGFMKEILYYQYNDKAKEKP